MKTPSKVTQRSGGKGKTSMPSAIKSYKAGKNTPGQKGKINVQSRNIQFANPQKNSLIMSLNMSRFSQMKHYGGQ